MVRFKNRYLLVEIEWENSPPELSLSTSALSTLLKEAIEVNFGECALAALISSQAVKYYNPKTNMILVRTSRDLFRMTWVAMTFIGFIKKRVCRLRIIHVSGTIRQAQRVLLQHHYEQQRKEDRLSEIWKKDIIALVE